MPALPGLCFILVISGASGVSVRSGQVSRSSGAWDKWMSETPMKAGRMHHAATALEEKIYVAGGQKSEPSDQVAPAFIHTKNVSDMNLTLKAMIGLTSKGHTGQVDIFDPKKSEWSAGPSLITTRVCFGLATLGDKIYAAGGWSSDQMISLSSVEVLEAGGSSWKQSVPMRHGRNGVALAPFGDKLYAVGGADSYGKNTKSTEVFDPILNDWVEGPSLLKSAEGLGLAELDGKLYAVGGLSNNARAMTDVQVLSHTQGWTKGAPLSTGRFQFGLAAFAGKLYAVGGADFIGRPLSSVEVFDPSSGSWTAGPSLSTARRSFDVAIVGQIHALGGMAGDGASKSTERLGNSTGFLDSFPGSRFLQLTR